MDIIPPFLLVAKGGLPSSAALQGVDTIWIEDGRYYFIIKLFTARRHCFCRLDNSTAFLTPRFTFHPCHFSSSPVRVSAIMSTKATKAKKASDIPFEDNGNRYVVEPAGTGRSSCKRCKEKIEKGALRFGSSASGAMHGR